MDSASQAGRKTLGNREGEVRRALVQFRGVAASTGNGNTSMVESIGWRMNYGMVISALLKLLHGIL